ncbi:MAG: PilZ domain-containing protein [Planctomycetes bacterium]|nr:PilZ domain-containing protein [Planctomycetota bacterium]
MAQQQQPAPEEGLRRAGVEARGQRRYRCPPESIVRLAVRPSFQSFPALVHDVSADGLGFLLDRPLAPDTVLALQLQGERPGTSVIRIARVVHVRRHLPVKNAPWIKKKPLLRSLLAFFSARSGEGTSGEDFIWLIGCRLSPPLSEEELRGLRVWDDGPAPPGSDSP